MEMKKVRFKYATWKVRGLGEKEEESDKTLNENHNKIPVITESRKKLWCTKRAENYKVIYSGVYRYTSGQAGVVTWIHKSTANKTDLDPVRSNCNR